MTAPILDIVLHALAGLLLAGLLWALGLGVVALALRRAPTPREAVDAYAPGLLVVTAVAAVALLEPWLGLVAALAALALLVPFARSAAALGTAARSAALALPGALALGVVLGLLWHGPSEEHDSRLYGDMLFYVNKVVSARISLAPFHDLLAEGQRIIYAEGAPSFVGAAFAPFDPILFHTTTLPVVFVVSVALGFRLLVGRWTAAAASAAAALAVVAGAYPTFLVESPPMTLALPLAFPVYRLWADELSLRHAALLAGAVALGLFWTKALGLLAVGVVVLLAAHRRYGRALGPRFWALLGLGAAAVVVGLFLTADWYADLVKTRFFPEEALEGARAQLDRRDAQAAAPALILVGQVLLLAFLLRARLHAFAAAYGASIAAAWFVGGYGFDVSLGLGALLAAVAVADRGLRLGALGWSAVAVLLLSAWARDILGVDTALLLLALLGGSVLAALAPLPVVALGAVVAATLVLIVLAGAAFVGIAALGAVALAAALGGRRAATGIALAAAAAAVVLSLARADDLSLGDQRTTLTSDDYAIWREVHERVPPDGLVFTSQTGPGRDADEGWNNYPSIAGRQLYLAGWIDGRLVSRPDELERRLDANERVLSGETPPSSLDLSRDFDGFYAVLGVEEEPPGGAEQLYANERFALYRLGS